MCVREKNGLKAFDWEKINPPDWSTDYSVIFLADWKTLGFESFSGEAVYKALNASSIEGNDLHDLKYDKLKLSSLD